MTSLGARDFVPVLLGTDNTTYAVARSIHQNYGVNSFVLGRQSLEATSDSKILTRILDPEITNDAVLKRHLLKLKESEPQLPHIVIPCGDGYAKQISRIAQWLTAQGFLFNVASEELNSQLENKSKFYEICEQHGLKYPQTHILSAQAVSSGDFSIPFDFPIALKADDSIEYTELKFEGKKKAYRIDSEAELRRVLSKIYAAGYTGSLITQEFILGTQENMSVLNAYVNRAGEVKMMCLGQCVLDAVHPLDIGNYHALYTIDGSEIYPVFKKFLEDVGCTGYANFDLKRNDRDGRVNVFEINLRTGSSSMYMEFGGCHFITYLIDDLLGTATPAPPHLHTKRGKMYLNVAPSLVKKYAPKSIRQEALEVLRSGYGFNQWYSKDRTWPRWKRYVKNRLASIHSYHKYAKRP